MLLQFKVKNFKSIGDEITLDMVAGSGSEHRQFVVDKGGVGVLPVASIYGGNASGKTNVIEALTTMLVDIASSYMYGTKDHLLAVPFLYDHELQGQATEYEMFFTINGREYQYGYIATRDEIASEWLRERKLSKNDTKWHGIFERGGDDVSFSAEYKKLKEYYGLVGKKTLLLSFLGNKQTENTEVFKEIYYWIDYSVFWQELSWDSDTIAEYYSGSEDIKHELIGFVNEFDPCLEDVVIEKEIGKKGEEKYRIFSMHKGEKYPIDIESEGTRKLLKLYASLSGFFYSDGGIFIVDELDSQLHPLILRRIINMFHDKEVNTQSAQLIFTSHNLIVLDNRDMRRDEIWFTEKDDRGFTNLYSLAEFKANEKEIRADLNYGKNYLAGKFGAIPYLNLAEGDQ